MIWCVEDDASIRDIELYALTSTGFEARGFDDGASFWEALQTETPELVLLDVMLPGEDGVSLLKKMKAAPALRDIPVIMATAKGAEYDKIQSLDLGADDYLVKPFGVMEMVSRVKAVLRRCHPADTGHVLSAGGLSMDLDCRTVTADGQRLQLTYKEFELLRLFLSHPGMAFTREQLFTQVWNMEYMDDSRTLDMHIRTLRQKLGAYGKLIETVRNVGYRMETGLTPEIVEKLSKEKDDPAWMQQFRLESLQIYNEMKIPDWGPSIEGLDMDHIATYVRPNTKMRNDWKDVPEDIKETFERLGIPQAERKSLAGVGAQYDSELVYHNVKDSVAAEGVVYTDMESAMKGEYADMVRKYFMKLVTPRDHKFAALHGAVWSGGSFVYVPKGVHLSIPLQSYFRLNAKGAGQFEHTLIIVDEGASLHFIEGCSAPKYNVANLHAGCVELFVKKGAKLRYSTIENWSKNMYNLNTKRALVEEGGTIEWVSGSFGSHVGCLYPMSILKGDNSRMEFTGVTFAGAGQNLDTGAKVVHVGKNTSSYMNTRSISKSGGISTFRSSVVVQKGATGAKSAVSCQSLMLDSESRSDTIPAMDIRTKDAAIGHEAKIGAISNEAVFYLMSRGMSEEDARALIVSGFADNVSKELPVEYAVEMNNLIRLEMKGSIG